MTERGKSDVMQGLSRGQILFCVMSVVAMIMTFALSDVAIEAMSEGMRICVSTVIPSLFPFMVFSELLISSGAAELVGRYLGIIFAKLFDLSREGSVALMLGFLCGFPIGSRSAISLYERGRISRGETEHILCFCNNPSSAFLISAVGVSLFGSQSIGVALYGSCILSSAVVGLFGRAYFRAKKRKNEFFHGGGNTPCRAREGFIDSLTRAVGEAAGSVMTICAFVIFFSAVIGYLRYFAQRAELPDAVSALLFGFLEMTGGVSEASRLSPEAAIIAVAAITGWSGLSVAFQFVGICKEHRFSLKPYFISKICAATLNIAFMLAFTKLFGLSACFSEGSISSFLYMPATPFATASLVLFGVGCVYYGRKRGKELKQPGSVK